MTPALRRAVTRRQLLRGAGVLAVAGLGAISAGSVGRSLGVAFERDPTRRAAARLAAAIGRHDEMVRVGRAALAAGVVETDPAVLLVRLFQSAPTLEAALRDGSDVDIRASLDAARLREFATAGPVVTIGGWVVAPAEARSCAVVALA